MIPHAEREAIRGLARQVAEIAAAPANAAIKKRWRDVNALRPPDRAPVWCRPVGAWGELLPDDALTCSEPWLRNIERSFCRILIKHDIGDDTPVDDTFPVNARFDIDPPNVWGVDVQKERPDDADGAWAYDPPLKTDADLDRLALPTFTYNAGRTDNALNQADALLGDILPVRLVCGEPLTVTMGSIIADLRGLTQMMMDAAIGPALLHRIATHVRDGVMKAMDDVAAAGLLTPNNSSPMNCSDPVGAPDDTDCTYKNMWCMANSQEFDQVSPAMWEEFCLNYQMPILQRFGLVGYGCCENLTHKIDGVLRIPNLRIFVCSAWTDLDKVIGRCGTDYVIMWRQKASDIVFPHDLDTIRADLEEGIRKLRGYRYQIVLRELQTLAGHPRRLHDWTRLAKELAEREA
jgi:hypothetical protein